MNCDSHGGRPEILGTAPTYSTWQLDSGSGNPPNGQQSKSTYVAKRNDFDIFTWHEAHKRCLKYFLDIAQHDVKVQSVAGLLNIRLPFQWTQHPVSRYHLQSTKGLSAYQHRGFPVGLTGHTSWVSLLPYIRRLVATGFDTNDILHSFFGNEWPLGVSELQEVERRNFLFTVKSVGWAKTKCQYDMPSDELIPFIRPLRNVKIEEIVSAEQSWSKWLAMEDWMIGPRDPDAVIGTMSQGGNST